MRETTVYIHTIQDLTSHISDGHHCELRIVFKRKSTLYFPSVCQSLQLPPSLYEDVSKESPENITSRWKPCHFTKVVCIFIATHATYFYTWLPGFYTSESFPKIRFYSGLVIHNAVLSKIWQNGSMSYRATAFKQPSLERVMLISLKHLCKL
jgi:hypothetical protein